MSNRLHFEIVCPSNHNQTVEYTEQEFEERLKADCLVFHCNTCDTDWSATADEITMFRKQFRKHAPR